MVREHRTVWLAARWGFRRPGTAGLATLLLCIIALIFTNGCKESPADEKPVSSDPAPSLTELKIGYFGNLTHAQAVLGVASGEFADAIKPVTLKTKVFNAGPSFIEALIAKQIDIGYVGPGPTLNAYVRGRGEDIRVLAGAAANGVLIVASNSSGIQTLADLKGKRIATPQLGNTQDIDCKYYVTNTLGQSETSNVLPINNTEQSQLMRDGRIDAAWVPEPWGSRLIAEADAHLVAEEKDLWPSKQFTLTVVVTSPDFLAAHPDVVRKFLTVHHNWTKRLAADPEKYLPQLGDALFALSGKTLPKGVLASSIKTVQFTDDPLPDTLTTMSDWAFKLGFAPRPANLAGLVDTSILNSIRAGESGPP